MTIFAWHGKTRSGQPRSGEMEAANKDIAHATLRRQGLVDIKVKKKPTEIKLFSEKVTDKDITIFFRQLSTMINAGLPLVQCLDILATQTENKAFGRVLMDVKTHVESGSTFSDALRRHPRVFDDLFVNLVRAGEQAGGKSSPSR